jgi:hypothetical protein
MALSLLAAMPWMGCRLSLWSWGTGSGTHELSVPPAPITTPGPTPESRG